MRLLPIAVLVGLLLVLAPVPSTTAASTSPPGPLRITELLANPDPVLGQREFIELWNPGNATVDLVGWTLNDAPTASGSSNEFTFSAGRLAPNARIVVWSNSTAGGSADARGPAWSTSTGKSVWNDAGDAATLTAPDGTIADWFAYGNSAAVAPPGFEGQAKPAAPPRGQAVALDGATWSAGSPTPALAPGTVGAVATATVANVAPTASLGGLPETTKPGTAVDVALAVADGNGAADIAAWTLRIDNAAVAQGTGAAPPATFRAVAPAVSGPWTFRLTVTDAAGLAADAVATVEVKDPRLSLQLPAGVLRFPELRPGDANVTALDWATLRNEGLGEARPLLDVSAFSGPGTMDVAGRLSVGVRLGNATAPTWIPYGGPLTPLPPLPAGASLAFTLRLDRVPAPLAAGAYGTTFAVVAG